MSKEENKTEETELTKASAEETAEEKATEGKNEQAEKTDAEITSDTAEATSAKSEADSKNKKKQKEISPLKELKAKKKDMPRKEYKAEKKKVKKEMKADKTRPISKAKVTLLLVLLFLFTFLLAGVIWALNTWSVINMDELLFHLRVSLRGTNPDMVKEFILYTVGGGLLVTIPAAFLLIKFSRKRGKVGRIIYRVLQLITSFILIGAILGAWFGFGLGKFIRNQFRYSNLIAQEYVDPGTVKLTFPEKKRNLIFIYMESMEMTFTDEANGGAFEENIIPELTEMAKENEDFSGNSSYINGGIALPCTIWTMGAIFGTTSGLPLKTPLSRNGMSEKNSFFPGIVNMGDILEDAGYNNRLIMGTDATFGGCRLYYESHGDFTIHDYEYAKDVGLIPEDYKVWWGYEDEKLFAYAQDELLELSKEDKPFHLVLQTMDTHFEDGHYCPQCDRKFGKNKYANVMNCSSRMVQAFVEWAKTQDFYENTTIVITGDHPTMDTDFCENVPNSYQRKTYTCIINPAVSVKDPDKVRKYSTLDLFPTTLAAMGVEIEGNRLGLGTNLFSDTPTLLERYEQTKVETDFDQRSTLMEKMFKGQYTSPGKKQK